MIRYSKIEIVSSWLSLQTSNSHENLGNTLLTRMLQLWHASFFMLVSCSISVAQNLVPNPSFELFYECPPYLGQIQQAVSWDSPNNKTTDYFHRCSPVEDGASVPENRLGVQEPADGDAYSGIRTWLPIIEGNPIYREYLSCKLISPLHAGVSYRLSFKVSVAEGSGYLSNDIGMYLSSTPITPEDAYYYKPQLSYSDPSVLENQNTWIEISSTYEAEGGEQYLILGNFLDDQSMTRVVNDASAPVVYYYIDAVAVSPCHLVGDQEIQLDTFLCEGGSMELVGPENALTYTWENQSINRERRIEHPGVYQLRSDFGCYQVQSMFQVDIRDCSCDLVIPSPQLAHQPLQIILPPDTQDLVLELFSFSGRYLKQIKETGAQVVDLPSGLYFWKGRLICDNQPTQLFSGTLVLIYGR